MSRRTERSRNYILGGDARTPVPVDLLTWAKAFEDRDPERPPRPGDGWARVAYDEVASWTISTVFLGLDHNYSERGPAILFETMVFSDGDDVDTARYATWDAAAAGHRKIVERLRAEWPPR